MLLSCSVIVNIADIKPKTKYIVAVDDSNCTLEEIVQVLILKLQVFYNNIPN